MKRNFFPQISLALVTVLLVLNLWLMLQRPARSAPPPAVEYKVMSLKMLMKDSPVNSHLSEEADHSDRIEKGMTRLGKDGWHLAWIQGDYYMFTK